MSKSSFKFSFNSLAESFFNFFINSYNLKINQANSKVQIAKINEIAIQPFVIIVFASESEINTFYLKFYISYSVNKIIMKVERVKNFLTIFMKFSI